MESFCEAEIDDTLCGAKCIQHLKEVIDAVNIDYLILNIIDVCSLAEVKFFDSTTLSEVNCMEIDLAASGNLIKINKFAAVDQYIENCISALRQRDQSSQGAQPCTSTQALTPIQKVQNEYPEYEEEIRSEADIRRSRDIINHSLSLPYYKISRPDFHEFTCNVVKNLEVPMKNQDQDSAEPRIVKEKVSPKIGQRLLNSRCQNQQAEEEHSDIQNSSGEEEEKEVLIVWQGPLSPTTKKKLENPPSSSEANRLITFRREDIIKSLMAGIQKKKEEAFDRHKKIVQADEEICDDDADEKICDADICDDDAVEEICDADADEEICDAAICDDDAVEEICDADADEEICDADADEEKICDSSSDECEVLDYIEPIGSIAAIQNEVILISNKVNNSELKESYEMEQQLLEPVVASTSVGILQGYLGSDKEFIAKKHVAFRREDLIKSLMAGIQKKKEEAFDRHKKIVQADEEICDDDADEEICDADICDDDAVEEICDADADEEICDAAICDDDAVEEICDADADEEICDADADEEKICDSSSDECEVLDYIEPIGSIAAIQNEVILISNKVNNSELKESYEMEQQLLEPVVASTSVGILQGYLGSDKEFIAKKHVAFRREDLIKSLMAGIQKKKEEAFDRHKKIVQADEEICDDDADEEICDADICDDDAVEEICDADADEEICDAAICDDDAVEEICDADADEEICDADADEEKICDSSSDECEVLDYIEPIGSIAAIQNEVILISNKVNNSELKESYEMEQQLLEPVVASTSVGILQGYLGSDKEFIAKKHVAFRREDLIKSLMAGIQKKKEEAFDRHKKIVQADEEICDDDADEEICDADEEICDADICDDDAVEEICDADADEEICDAAICDDDAVEEICDADADEEICDADADEEKICDSSSDECEVLDYIEPIGSIAAIQNEVILISNKVNNSELKESYEMEQQLLEPVVASTSVGILQGYLGSDKEFIAKKHVDSGSIIDSQPVSMSLPSYQPGDGLIDLCNLSNDSDNSDLTIEAVVPYSTYQLKYRHLLNAPQPIVIKDNLNLDPSQVFDASQALDASQTIDDVYTISSGRFISVDDERPRTPTSVSQINKKRKSGIESNIDESSDNENLGAEKDNFPVENFSPPLKKYRSELNCESSQISSPSEINQINDIFDYEAQLSGDEMSADESDGNVGDDEAEQEQAANIFCKHEQRDEDARMDKRLQQDFLPEGELHVDGSGRQNRFHWSNKGASYIQNEMMSESDPEDIAESSIQQDKMKWRQETSVIQKVGDGESCDVVSNEEYGKVKKLPVSIVGKSHSSQTVVGANKNAGKSPLARRHGSLIHVAGSDEFVPTQRNIGN